jgi:hypothetical protein
MTKRLQAVGNSLGIIIDKPIAPRRWRSRREKAYGAQHRLVFLDLNGWVVADPGERLYDATLSIATGLLDKRGLAALLQELAVRDADEV